MSDTIIETAETVDAVCEIYGNCQEDFDSLVDNIQEITMEQHYYINAWGAMNGLIAMVAIFIWVEEVSYWKDDLDYSNKLSPWKEWYWTSFITFVVGTWNTLLWGLQAHTDSRLWLFLFTRFQELSIVAPFVPILGSYYANKGYSSETLIKSEDPNFTQTFYTTLAGGSLELLVWILSVKPIWDAYNEEKAEMAAV